MERTQFRYVIRFVTDMNKAVEFYRDTFGADADIAAELYHPHAIKFENKAVLMCHGLSRISRRSSHE